MGFWSGFFQKREEFTKQAEAVLFEDRDCSELVPAVGESNYQEALRQLCSSDSWEDVAFDCIAVLTPEPDNPYDNNAIMVQIDGNCVGYLSRENAVAYRRMILEVAETGRFIACRARIAGRGPNGAEVHTSNLGVFLKLPPADEPVEL